MKRNWELLKVLSKAKPKQRKAIVATSSNDLVLAICEVVDNMLKGTLKLNAQQKKKLGHYKSVLREIANRKVSQKKKKELIVQKGGFLGTLLVPALSLIASLIGQAVSK